MLRFVVPFEPVPMPQGKVVWHKSLRRMVKVQPATVLGHRALVRMYAETAVRSHSGVHEAYPLQGAVVVGFAFYRRKPAKPQRWERQPGQRPDLENYMELVADALTGLVYADDSQIVGHLAYPFTGKHYAEEGTTPRTEIIVAHLGELMDGEVEFRLRA